MSRMTTMTDKRGMVTTWRYDACGQLISKTYADETTEFYKYDKAHQLRKLTRADGKAIRYRYDDLGRQVSVDYGDSRTGDITRSFDAAGRKLSESVAATAHSPASSFAYTHDARGLVTNEVQTIHGRTFTIARTFNGEGQVEQLTYPKLNARR